MRLLPCPFCGCAGKMQETHKRHWLVVCQGCPARGKSYSRDGAIEQAIASWNTRAPCVPQQTNLIDGRCGCGKCLDCDAIGYAEDKARAQGMEESRREAADTLALVRGMLAEHAGEQTQAGEAFKVVDAAVCGAKIGGAA